MIQLPQSPVVFKEEPHGYWLGDTQLCGITGLIKFATGLGVYADASDFVKNVAIPRAGCYGSSVHNAIELFDKMGIENTVYDTPFGQFDVTDELNSYKQAISGFTSIANEYTVSDGKRWASNIDNVWQYNDTNGIWLADTKTNNLDYYPGGEEALREYLSWQLSIYAYLFEKQTGLEVEGLIGNWFRKGEVRQWSIERKDNKAIEWILSAVPSFDELDGKFHYRIGQAPACANLHNDIIQSEDMPIDTTGLPEQYQQRQFLAECAETLRMYEYYAERVENLKAGLRAALEAAKRNDFATDQFTAKIGASSVSNTFDTTKFKKDHPDLYEQYMKTTTRKGAFSLKLNKEI